MARSDGRTPPSGRRTVLAAVFAAAVAVGAAVVAVVASNAPEGDRGAGRSAPAGPTLYVDADSRGGRCSDRRRPDQVSSRRPWCSLYRAVVAAPARATVLVRQGRYGDLAVAGRTGKPLTVRAARGERPVLDGLNIVATRDLHVAGFRITDVALIEASHHVTVTGSDVSPHGFVVSGGADLRFAGNHVHDLTIDFPEDPDAPGARCHVQDERAGLAPRCGYAFRINANSRVAVVGNRIEDIPADGVQLAGTADVRIAGNRFERIQLSVDPAEHPDAIQMVGGNARTRIQGNVFVESRGIIAHADPRENPQWPGTASDLVIEDNLFARMEQWAATLYDVENLRFARNTAGDAGTAGVVLREDPASPQRMSGVRFVGNIVSVLAAEEPMLAESGGNLIGRGPRLGAGDITGQPRFRGPDALDYRLLPGSPFEGRGASPGVAAGTPAA